MRDSNMKWFITIFLVIAVIAVAWLSVFKVDAAEYAFVTVLGRHTETFDGVSGDTGAGLHLSWPWPIRSVQRLDRRLQILDLRPTEVLTYDPSGKSVGENMTVEAFVTWK